MSAHLTEHKISKAMTENVKAERRFTKSELLFLRISPQLKAQVSNKSQLEGKSISEYIRDLIKEDLNKK